MKGGEGWRSQGAAAAQRFARVGAGGVNFVVGHTLLCARTAIDRVVWCSGELLPWQARWCKRREAASAFGA